MTPTTFLCRASAVVGLVAVLGCAAPSRYLPARTVDDPIVLPQGLFALSVGESVTRYSTRSGTDTAFQLPFRYGITDRLELDALSLRYAFLDDAPPPADGRPADSRRRGPVSVAVRAGVEGIGYSSLEGAIVMPTLSVLVRKRLGARALVWTSAGANAAWIASPVPATAPYNSTLWPPWPNSVVVVSAGTRLQIVEHVALGAMIGVHQIHACAVPACAWATRGATASLGPLFRPWRFLDLSLSGELGARERSSKAIAPNFDMPEIPPSEVRWWNVSGAATLYW